MKRIACTLLSVSMLPLFAAETTAVQPRFEAEAVERTLPRRVLSNQGIVMLSAAGYSEEFLIILIQRKETRFDTTAEGLALLANHGVSERIIRCMLANENKPAAEVSTAPATESSAPPVVVRGRVVRQKVVVPDIRATPQTVAAPAMIAGTQIHPAGVPAGFQNGSPATGPYVVGVRHLFRKRWYVVNPDYTSPASTVPLPRSGRLPVPAYSELSRFPAW